MGSQTQIQVAYPRKQIKFVPPRHTLGYLIIISMVAIGTTIVILTNNYSTFYTDGEKVIDEWESYRTVTSVFAVSSFGDLVFMLLSFIWLLFTLTQFERKYSTLYVIYHFWKVTSTIALGVAALYLLFYATTRMKNFTMSLSGIYPYSLLMYLKGSLAEPSRPVNHWFLPFPVNRWVMGFLVVIASVFLAPESQGCIVVFFFFLFSSLLRLLNHITGKQCFYIQGPLITKLWICFDRLVPGCIKNSELFCLMKEKKNDQQSEQQQQHQLEEINQEVKVQNS